MVIIDYFKKWSEVYTIPNQKTAIISRILVENWICRCRFLMEMHFDQGYNFKSGVFLGVCEILGRWKIRTTLLRLNHMVELSDKTTPVESRKWSSKVLGPSSVTILLTLQSDIRNDTLDASRCPVWQRITPASQSVVEKFEIWCGCTIFKERRGNHRSHN